MLAQSFKSAADLGITEPQKSALMKTLVLLETGKLRHIDTGGIQFNNAAHVKFDGLFNMSTWGSVASECGTIACIGGTAELVGNLSFGRMGEHRDLPDGLWNLFYAVSWPTNWREITPAQAATALRSYLTIGDARWDLAVAEEATNA